MLYFKRMNPVHVVSPQFCGRRIQFCQHESLKSEISLVSLEMKCVSLCILFATQKFQAPLHCPCIGIDFCICFWNFCNTNWKINFFGLSRTIFAWSWKTLIVEKKPEWLRCWCFLVFEVVEFCFYLLICRAKSISTSVSSEIPLREKSWNGRCYLIIYSSTIRTFDSSTEICRCDLSERFSGASISKWFFTKLPATRLETGDFTSSQHFPVDSIEFLHQDVSLRPSHVNLESICKEFFSAIRIGKKQIFLSIQLRK